jgi:lipoprotein-anchoring transpeptidase ErfK/SrfK
MCGKLIAFSGIMVKMRSHGGISCQIRDFTPFRSLQRGFSMRSSLLSVAGAAVAVTLLLAPAKAYEIDILTHQPMMPMRMTDADGRPTQSPVPREIVDYSGPHKPGTILVSTTERRLYFVLPGGQAVKYGVGVGRPGFEWAGTKTISRKAEWPEWTPPAQMLRRRPDLPRHMAGGIDNPLGARAMYLGSSLYRIHGSNEPDTIGQAVSSGCIRMTNDDISDLYERAKIGTRVIVLR